MKIGSARNASTAAPPGHARAEPFDRHSSHDGNTDSPFTGLKTSSPRIQKVFEWGRLRPWHDMSAAVAYRRTSESSLNRARATPGTARFAAGPSFINAHAALICRYRVPGLLSCESPRMVTSKSTTSFDPGVDGTEQR